MAGIPTAEELKTLIADQMKAALEDGLAPVKDELAKLAGVIGKANLGEVLMKLEQAPEVVLRGARGGTVVKSASPAASDRLSEIHTRQAPSGYSVTTADAGGSDAVRGSGRPALEAAIRGLVKAADSSETAAAGTFDLARKQKLVNEAAKLRQMAAAAQDLLDHLALGKTAKLRSRAHPARLLRGKVPGTHESPKAHARMTRRLALRSRASFDRISERGTHAGP